MAGFGQRQEPEKFQIEETEDTLMVQYSFRVPVEQAFSHTVRYLVQRDGSIQVTLSYPGVQGLPTMPVFGMDFRLPQECGRFVYFGNGPEENYIDRREGARLGVFRSTAAENFAGYLVPQECGNRTEVHWMGVHNQKGKGLLFRAVDKPFEMSVLPHSVMELESAAHKEELPVPNSTWVRILEGQMGVGGDDSWGAPVHEEYLLDSGEPRTITFEITGWQTDEGLLQDTDH